MPRISARPRFEANSTTCGVLGGSREAAKELKLFGLKDFLIGRFTRLSDQIYRENVDLPAAG